MRLVLLFIAVAFSAAPAFGAKLCGQRLAVVYSQTGLFAPDWDAPDLFLTNFARFSRVLALADSVTVDDARRIARAYPKTHVIGSDIEVILPEPQGRHWFHQEARELPNLTVMEIDVTKPFPLPDNTTELVYVRSGICHCEEDDKSCCGLPKRRPAVARFLREVWRVIDKAQPHSMAFFDGYQEPDVAKVWSDACHEVQAEMGFTCEQLLYSNGDSRGFLITH